MAKFPIRGEVKIKEDSMINKVIVVLVLAGAGCLFVPQRTPGYSQHGQPECERP